MPSQLNRVYPVVKDKYDLPGLMLAPHSPEITLPPSYDLSEWLGPVKDQGSLGACFTLDTSISLLDGRERTFAELREEFGTGGFWVYSYDPKTEHLVPGWAHDLRMTKKAAQVYTVTLDNGESFQCTKNHQFLKLDGTYEAPAVQHSYLGLYRELDSHGYELCRASTWKCARPTHRLIANAHLSKPDIPRYGRRGYDRGGWVVHHKGLTSNGKFNIRDNQPTSLEWMRYRDHLKLHSQSGFMALWKDPEWRAWKSEHNREIQQLSRSHPNVVAASARNLQIAQENNAVPSFSFNDIENLIENLGTIKNVAHALGVSEYCVKKAIFTHTDYKKFTKKHGLEKFNQHLPVNHKVISVQFTGVEDVYDITVDDWHNFALTAGIFAHNCTAFSWSSVREFIYRKYNQYERNKNVPANALVLSPMFLYYMERKLEGNIDQDSGAQSNTGAIVLSQAGVCLLADDNYDPSLFRTPPTTEQLKEALPYRSGAYHNIPNVPTLKSVIVSGHVASIGISVFDSFESNDVAATGNVPVPQKGETLLGGHEITPYGFDDTHENSDGSKGAIHILNSWGNNWGAPIGPTRPELGSLWLPYGYWSAAPDGSGPMVMNMLMTHLGGPWLFTPKPEIAVAN